MKGMRSAAGLLATFLILGVGFAQGWAQETPRQSETGLNLDRVLSHIETKARSLKTLKGNFVQLKHTRLLVTPIESEGLFYWRPPDRFRWEVTHFIPLVMVVQGHSVLMHYRDLNRATLFRSPMGESLLKQITGTAGDMETFKRTYHLSLGPPTGSDDSSFLQLSMEPVSSLQAKHLKRIDVTIDPARWLPIKITILGTSEDRTTIRLSHLAENMEIPESLFSVEPPEGVQLQQFQGGRRP